MASRSFGSRKGKKPHLAGPTQHGLGGEIYDLRTDVEAGFSFLESDLVSNKISSDPSALLRVDFTALSPGAYTSGAVAGTTWETLTGLRHSRADAVTCATIQTSTTTVQSGVTADQARVGQYGSGKNTRGYCHEESRTNYVWDNSNLSDNSKWVPTACTATPATSPDGTPNQAVTLTDTSTTTASNAQAATGIVSLTTTYLCSSVWCSNVIQPGPGLSISPSLTLSTGGGSSVANIAGWWDRQWRRNVAVSNGNTTALSNSSGTVRLINNGTKTSGGAIGSLAVATYALPQTENGRFSTEVIKTSGTILTRAGDKLVLQNGAKVLSSGALSMELKIIPKGRFALLSPGAGFLTSSLANSNTNLKPIIFSTYTTDVELWNVDANNRAFIDAATGLVNVTIGGVNYSATRPIIFSPFELVELFVAAGAGIATTIKYRLNGGFTNTLGTTTTQGAVVVPGALELLGNSNGGTPIKQFSGWVQKIAFYAAGVAPAWAQ